MPTVKRFEDLKIWHSSRELVWMVYIDTGQPEFSRDFGLKDQIRRASVSIMSNIAEGFGTGSDAEFVRFLGIARRSNSEVQSQAYIALDLKYISQERFQTLYERSNHIERQLNSLISYLTKSRHASVKEPASNYPINSSEPTNFTDLNYLSDLKDL